MLSIRAFGRRAKGSSSHFMPALFGHYKYASIWCIHTCEQRRSPEPSLLDNSIRTKIPRSDLHSTFVYTEQNF